jgi:hypothetical protein
MNDVADWRRAAAERARAFQEVVAIFHDEGVPLLTGTDSLNPWNVPGASLHAELANFVAAGMTPYQALRCATAEAGRFLGDGSGTLALGKRADLVVTRANPFRDLGALRNIEAVAVSGYYLPRAELDAMLAQRATLASAPPRLPATSLPNATVWLERIVGADAGRISFRHSRLPDGGWLIEERHAAAVPRRHVERRHSRLVLDSDFKLRSCEYSVDTFSGTERGAISRSAGGYEIEAKGLDGRESRHAVHAAPVLPSERLTVTLWPLLVQRTGSASILDVEEGALVIREMKFDNNQLTVSRPTHVTEQRYRFGADGKFLGMQETMPLLWLRELVPSP